MDSDQHRGKRSRLRSTEGNNDRSQRDDHEDDESEPNPTSQGRISATTSALGNISLQDKKSDNQAKAPHPVSHPALHPRSSNSNTAGFSNHPLLQHDRKPTADFSFRSFNQSKSCDQPISSGLDASDFAAQARSDLDRPSERPPLPIQSTTLPLHRSRDTKFTSSLIAGPSSKQIERDAIKPPPEKDSLSYTTSFLVACPPEGVRQLRADAETSIASDRKAGRPRPIYVPASENNQTNNPYAYKFAPHQSSQTSDRIVSSSPGVRQPYQSIRDPHAAAAFSYPSIYPANEKQVLQDRQNIRPITTLRPIECLMLLSSHLASANVAGLLNLLLRTSTLAQTIQTSTSSAVCCCILSFALLWQQTFLLMI